MGRAALVVREPLGLPSDVVGENQDADEGDCDHAEKKGNCPVTIGVRAMRRIALFVMGHGAVSFGPRHLDNAAVSGEFPVPPLSQDWRHRSALSAGWRQVAFWGMRNAHPLYTPRIVQPQP
jgi:hypothetical protein